MIFSDTINKNGIIQTCELLLDFNDGDISGNPTLLKQFTNLANKSYDNVTSQILQAEGDYTWDDYNFTNFPIGATNLVTTPGSEQADYTLPVAGSPGSTDPSSFIRFIKAQIKDAYGNYQNLYDISESMTDTPLETLYKQPGFPQYYQLRSNSITLYPAPLAAQVTATAGLKIFFQRSQIDFASTDTTKQPGFPQIYHYLMPLEMSEAWAAIKGLRQLGFIENKMLEFKKNLGWGISNQNKDTRQRIIAIKSRRDNRYE